MDTKYDQLERYKSAILALKEVSLNNKGIIKDKDLVNICYQNGVQKSILRGAVKAGLFGEAGKQMYVPKFSSNLSEEQINKVILVLRKLRRPDSESEPVYEKRIESNRKRPNLYEGMEPEAKESHHLPINKPTKKISVLWGLFKMEY